ncbi:hypothetical protein ACFE04_029108 [Oxalis oulophora]
MCVDCSKSRLSAFFPLRKQIGMIQGENGLISEKGENGFYCSCCGVDLETSELYCDRSYFIVKSPSACWENLEKDESKLLGFMVNANNDCEIEQKGEDESGIVIKSEVVDVHDKELDSLEADGNWSSFLSNDGDHKVENFVENDKVLEADEHWSSFVSNDSDHKVENFVENHEVLEADENWSSFVCNNGDKVENFVENDKELEANENWSSFVSNDGDHKVENIVEKEQEPEVKPETDLNIAMDKWVEVQAQHLDFYIDMEDCHLVPIEDSAAKMLEKINEGNFGEEDFIMDFDKPIGREVELIVKRPVLATIDEEEEDSKSTELESVESSNSLAAEVGEEICESSHEETKDVLEMKSDEIIVEVLAGPEIPEHESIVVVEASSTSCTDLHVQDNHGANAKHNENEHVEFRTLSVDTNEVPFNKHLSLCLELNEFEEDKYPDTPRSMDSVHYFLHKKSFLLERKESGNLENSLDGSIMSDIDSPSGVMTMEKLKTSLRAERKALNMLYAELEEERNASAVAANHTMAMINRLQEEKAAMQMEALQYQRMMEEQSEYDQEALQILNELMLKRERENAELEKELEMYRKEKITMLRSMRSRTSSASCSITADDSDGLSVDLNQEMNEDDSSENPNQNTPVDEILYLEESLASFEDERLLILEQLKVLEERLVTLNEEEDHHFEDEEPIGHIYIENGNGHDHSCESNGVHADYKEMNGKHHHDRKLLGTNAKRLLPLFDATDGRNGQIFDSTTLENSPIAKFETENKKHAIEEEVDHVYDKLQALEADREFLKHCISSLRKGDKGIHLLREILQHLRDLRSMELHARSSV